METPFAAAPHHDVLVLLVQIAVLLATARLLGEVAQRLKQPSIVGELLAGIVLGPSMLSGWFPALGNWLVPHTPTGGHLLEEVSMFGALFLLLLTGLEMDLQLVKLRARTAIAVSLGGIATSFSAGFALAWILPDSLVGTGDSRIVFSLFVAITLAISAIPVVAKVLMDLDALRRDVGQTIIAAGMSDDTIGWILLSVVLALADTGQLDAATIGLTLGKVLGFIAVSFLVVWPLVERVLNGVQDRGVSRDRITSLVVVLMFAWAAATQALHIEAALGAFLMGVLLGQMRRLPHDVVEKIETLSLSIFAPIFFASAGLKVDLKALMEPRLLAITLAVIAVATGGKVIGTYLGARYLGGRPHWNSLAYGAALNARGAMAILIAPIGLRLGIISTEMFSVIVVMAIVTSLMAPPALRFVLNRLEPDAAEKERLKREELREASRLGRITRALVPVRVRPDGAAATQSVEAFVLDQLEHGLAITLFTVVPANERARAQEFLASMRKLFPHRDVTTRVVVGDDPTGPILEEAARDYDLVVVGAPERQADGEVVFNRVIDTVIRTSPCATMVISGQHFAQHFPLKRILVPSGGSSAARSAAELAFLLVRGTEAEVNVLHVCEVHPGYVPGEESRLNDRLVEAAHEGIASLEAMGRTYGVRVDAAVRFADSVEAEVLRRIERDRVDLLILGTDVMLGTNRLFLGPRVERLITEARCPVLLLNA